MTLHFADIAVILLYFVFTLGLGFWVSRRNKNVDQYFLGGRSFLGGPSA